jgi:hypothetical protein
VARADRGILPVAIAIASKAMPICASSAPLFYAVLPLRPSPGARMTAQTPARRQAPPL